MAAKLSLLIASLLLVGCAHKTTFTRDKFGVPTPVINGVVYEMTEEERRFIADAFLDHYCI